MLFVYDPFYYEMITYCLYCLVVSLCSDYCVQLFDSVILRFHYLAKTMTAPESKKKVYLLANYYNLHVRMLLRPFLLP